MKDIKILNSLVHLSLLEISNNFLLQGWAIWLIAFFFVKIPMK